MNVCQKVYFLPSLLYCLFQVVKDWILRKRKFKESDEGSEVILISLVKPTGVAVISFIYLFSILANR